MTQIMPFPVFRSKIRHQAHKTERRLQILNQSCADCCPLHNTLGDHHSPMKGDTFRAAIYGQLGACCFKSEAHITYKFLLDGHNTLVLAILKTRPSLCLTKRASTVSRSEQYATLQSRKIMCVEHTLLHLQKGTWLTQEPLRHCTGQTGTHG